MSAALHLVRDDNHDGDRLTPLEAWEIYMRGAGRSDRTVRDGVGTMSHLERHAGKSVEQIRSVDVSRFLARPEIGPASRTAYYSSISSFFRWYAQNGGSDATAHLPRPKSPKSTPRGRCPVSDYVACWTYLCITGRAS